MKKDFAIQLGNTDNKLSQQSWSDFVFEVKELLEGISSIHFFGGASNWKKWQNVCFCFTCEEEYISAIKMRLSEIRSNYSQTSIALLEGRTEFI